MKHGRLLWAAVMAALSVTLLAGYTAAGELWALGHQAEPLPVFPPMQVEPVPVRFAASGAELLQIVVRDEAASPAGRVILSGDGIAERPAAPNRLGEYLMQLPAGGSYTLLADDGRAVTFFLEDNAAVSNVTGDGWTDGEILYLDTQVHCTLRLIRRAGTEAAYTLAGEGYKATMSLEDTAGGNAVAVFSPLRPGTYTLTGSDGSVRALTLTEAQPFVSLGLD